MAKVQLIVVEAGHGLSNWGTKDCGAVGRFGESVYIERNIAKEIAKRMLVILKGKPELKGCHIIQGVGIETEATKGAKTKFVNTVIRESGIKEVERLLLWLSQWLGLGQSIESLHLGLLQLSIPKSIDTENCILMIPSALLFWWRFLL
jgi:hypothetical protein